MEEKAESVAESVAEATAEATAEAENVAEATAEADEEESDEEESIEDEESDEEKFYRQLNEDIECERYDEFFAKWEELGWENMKWYMIYGTSNYCISNMINTEYNWDSDRQVMLDEYNEQDLLSDFDPVYHDEWLRAVRNFPDHEYHDQLIEFDRECEKRHSRKMKIRTMAKLLFDNISRSCDELREERAQILSMQEILRGQSDVEQKESEDDCFSPELAERRRRNYNANILQLNSVKKEYEDMVKKYGKPLCGFGRIPTI